MNVSIECYGAAARLSGGVRHTVALPAGARVTEALGALALRAPGLERLLASCACAVGDALVPRTRPLAEGDCLAVLPPVSGG